jgi:uncharacterized protein YbjT (DUF2867 family)
MFVVTAPTGNIGRDLVPLLIAAGGRVRALARDPAKVEAREGLEVVRADLDRSGELAPQLRRADALFLLSPGPNVAAQDTAVITAAKAAGVRRVVMLSSWGIAFDAGGGPAHRPGEEALRASGLAFTILRPSEFMSNALRWAGTIAAQGVVYEPGGEGRHAVIDPRDIAAVAAKVLTTPGHEGAVYVLTGSEATSPGERVATLARVLGRPLTRVEVPDEALGEQLRGAGLPPFLIEAIVRFYTLVRRGEIAGTSPDVERLLGRPAATFEDWARRNAAAFS